MYHDLDWKEQDRLTTAEEMREELVRLIDIAREALFLVKIDDTLRPDGKMSKQTMEMVNKALIF